MVPWGMRAASAFVFLMVLIVDDDCSVMLDDVLVC